MDLNLQIEKVLRTALGYDDSFGNAVKIVRSISGGSINKCYEIEFASERFFLKTNSLNAFPQMFIQEAKGLASLANTKSISIPRVIGTGAAGVEQFLLLHWIETGPNTAQSQQMLGQQLAQMHKCSDVYYGLDYDNYMGSLVQRNGSCNSIIDFFIEKRLQVQLDFAAENGLLSDRMFQDFDKLFDILPQIIPPEVPALVHGDLWSGNYMIDKQGVPYLIDPAVAYSHREVDIAMTALFGGFDQAFYNAYQECYPLEKGWEERISLWNLDPLLVHLNLFGKGYLHDIQRSLKRFT